MRIETKRILRLGAWMVIMLSVVLSSCRLVDPHDPNDISLTVGAQRYLVGESAELTIRNESGRTIAFNLCFADLERQEGTQWIPVDRAGTCSDLHETLTHGEQASYAYLLAPTLQAGTYRFAYTFAPAGDEELTLLSNRFDVDRP